MCRRYSTGTDPYFSWHKKQCLDIKKKDIYFSIIHTHTQEQIHEIREESTKFVEAFVPKTKNFLIELKEKNRGTRIKEIFIPKTQKYSFRRRKNH